MWQRWNQTSHIFEKSTDNGANWSPLGLNGAIITEGTIADARLSSNVALINGNNAFTGNNSFNSGAITIQSNTTSIIYITGSGLAELRMTDSSQATDNKMIRLMNYQNLFQVWMATDSGGMQGNLTFDRAGNLKVSGYYYEKGRTTAQGRWIDEAVGDSWFAIGGAGAGNWARGTVYVYGCSITGDSLRMQVYVSGGTWYVASNQINLLMPLGKIASKYASGIVIAAGSIINYEIGWCYATPGSGWLTCHRNNLVNWPVSTGVIVFLSIEVPIQ